MLKFLPRPQWLWLHWLWRLPLFMLLLIVLLLLLWRTLPVTMSSFILQHQFTVWWSGEGDAPRQEWVDYKAISPQLVLAVIASEDQLFPVHRGIDWSATQHAMEEAFAGRHAGGGSTITQQLAKNLFLWSGRSYLRKGLEWLLALLIEVTWDKRRIIEVYLNIAQFSDQDYGVGSAAELLGKSPARLNPADAALLAAVLPAPAQYHIKRPSRRVKQRQHHILKQMRQLGGVAYLTTLSTGG